MSLQALVAFAVEVAEETGSQTPFYIAGGLLALWAVVASFVGMRRQSFPGSSRARAGVMAVTTVLVVAAMASAVLSS